MSENTAIIGVGTIGCKIIDKLDTTFNKIFIDTEKEVIENYSGIFIGPNVFSKYTTQRNIQKAELAVRESKNEILAAIEPYSKLVIVAPLGGGSGGAAKRIVELGLDENKTVKLILSLPFNFEGSNSIHRAEEVYNYVKNICPIIKIGKISFVPDEKITVRELYKRRDTLFITEILKAISEQD